MTHTDSAKEPRKTEVPDGENQILTVVFSIRAADWYSATKALDAWLMFAQDDDDLIQYEVI